VTWKLRKKNGTLQDIKGDHAQEQIIHVLGNKAESRFGTHGLRSKEKWQEILAHAQRAKAYQIEEILMIKTL